ncbi:MAG: SDR family oxidoreductase [Alicyclobacillaceae bacterium]|nr:SDR family oxidoreductase [Alicyclobacillaceae bacterium]
MAETVLAGQTAVVTGAASGIGKGIAEELCRLGARVIIADINGEGAQRTAEEFTQRGWSAVARTLDVTDSAAVAAMFTSLVEQYQRVEILVNNAGYAEQPTLITDLDDTRWLRMINVHLNGTFYCLREAAKVMKRQRYGRIVNMSSLATDGGLSGLAHYTAAKSGILGLTETAAKELARYQITVNAVKPGLIRTPLGEEGLLAIAGERFRYVTPVHRIGEPADVAKVVGMLVRPEMSFVTGVSILIDGGLKLMKHDDVAVLEMLGELGRPTE